MGQFAGWYHKSFATRCCVLWCGLAHRIYFAVIKGHEVEEGYLVTGMLVPLIVPVDLPLWMLAVAVAFGVIIGKEVFGGTGMNILNPALPFVRSYFCLSYMDEWR